MERPQTAFRASYPRQRFGGTTGAIESPIPNFILLDPCPEGNEFKSFKAGNWAGWLGAEYGPVRLGGSYKIPDVHQLADITSEDHEEREALRKFFSRKFENERSVQRLLHRMPPLSA